MTSGALGGGPAGWTDRHHVPEHKRFAIAATIPMITRRMAPGPRASVLISIATAARGCMYAHLSLSLFTSHRAADKGRLRSLSVSLFLSQQPPPHERAVGGHNGSSPAAAP
uniref:Uncharacterized protein n=1 Tax=Plectus sambesii TaxID=2011161 RepID=A0A914VNN4_9BILA